MPSDPALSAVRSRRIRFVGWLLAFIPLLFGAGHVFLWYSVFFAGADPSLLTAQLLDLDHEVNPPTLFSVLLWAACFVLLVRIAYRRHVMSLPHALYWFLLAALSFFFVLDELGAIHERLLYSIMRSLDLAGHYNLSWTLLALVVAGILLFIFWRPLRRLPRAYIRPVVFGFGSSALGRNWNGGVGV